MHQRDVDLFHLARCELRGQIAMRGVVACDQDHAAGEAIQAMHDAGPQVAANGRKLSEAVQHGVDQSARMPAGAGVNHHSARAC